MHAKQLGGKVALVTGGSRGIGRAIALRLAEEGADVVISYASSGSKADPASLAEVAELVKGVAARFGRLDILVNSAGVYAGGVTGDPVVAFLAGPEASFITGTSLNVDGGINA